MTRMSRDELDRVRRGEPLYPRLVTPPREPLSDAELAKLNREVFSRDEDAFWDRYFNICDDYAQYATGVHECPTCFRMLEDPNLCESCGPIAPVGEVPVWRYPWRRLA